jgi:hypothetical protein
MADIQFDEERYNQVSSVAPTEPFSVRFLVGKGIVSNAQQATYVMIGIAVVATCIAVYFFWYTGSTPSPSVVDPRTIDQSKYANPNK